MRIALLCAPISHQASTVEEFISGYSLNSIQEVVVIRIYGGMINFNLNDFDAILLHYSLISYPFRNSSQINEVSRMLLSNYQGPKLALVQDEYRCINERIAFFNAIGVFYVLSVINRSLLDLVYPPNLRGFQLDTVLTGYFEPISEFEFDSLPSLKERKTDVFYRGRILPAWMGKTATQKSEIPTLVQNSFSNSSYVIDVASDEKSRLYGHKWTLALQDSRVTLGSPSGFEFADKLGHLSFANIDDCSCGQCLLNINVEVISPRIFEYVNARTLMALTPGEYSGVLRPYQHYFPLNEDLSNLEELIRFSKSKEAQSFVDSVFQDLCNNQNIRYRNLATMIDKLLVAKIGSKSLLIVKTRSNTKNNYINFSRVLKKYVFWFLLKFSPILLRKFLKKVYNILPIFFQIPFHSLSRKDLFVIFSVAIKQVQCIGDFLNLMYLASLSRELNFHSEIDYEAHKVHVVISSRNFREALLSHLDFNRFYQTKHFSIDLGDFSCMESSFSLEYLDRWLRFNFDSRAERLVMLLKALSNGRRADK